MSDDDSYVDNGSLRRISNIRKRAAPTGSSFDFIRVGVICPQCSKEGLQPIAELEVNGDAICPYCGVRIDLSSNDSRAKISKLAEEYKQIKVMKMG